MSTVIINTTLNGYSSPEDSVEVTSGTDLTINITPGTNCSIFQILVDNVPVEISNPFILTNVVTDHVVDIIFGTRTLQNNINQVIRTTVFSGSSAEEQDIPALGTLSLSDETITPVSRGQISRGFLELVEESDLEKEFIMELLPKISRTTGVYVGTPAQVNENAMEGTFLIHIDAVAGNVRVILEQSADYDGVMPVEDAHWSETCDTGGGDDLIVGIVPDGISLPFDHQPLPWLRARATIAGGNATVGAYFIPSDVPLAQRTVT